MRFKEGSAHYKRIEALAETSKKIARPKGLYEAFYMEVEGDDKVVISDTIFKSRVMKVNLEQVHRIFLFVATCGRELDDWSKSLTDTLDRFIVNAIKAYALGAAAAGIDRHIEETYGTGKVSKMTPGSLKDWPITEQRSLFHLLNDVEGDIGVRLKSSLMMDPKQSVSGLIFPTEVRYENCQLCPMEKCPGRRAAYDPELYEKKYSMKNPNEQKTEEKS
jgi:hypothetical protein